MRDKTTTGRCSLCSVFSNMTPREFQEAMISCGYVYGLEASWGFAMDALCCSPEYPLGPMVGMSEEERRAFNLAIDLMERAFTESVKKKRPTRETIRTALGEIERTLLDEERS